MVYFFKKGSHGEYEKCKPEDLQNKVELISKRKQVSFDMEKRNLDFFNALYINFYFIGLGNTREYIGFITIEL